MAYIVNNTRGNVVAVVQDGTINTTATSLALVGRNVSPYGQINLENLVKQLENFTDDTPPDSPQQGQLWYDLPNTSLKVWTGTIWKTVSGLTVSSGAPSSAVVPGDLWYNPSTNILQIWTGTAWSDTYTVPFFATPPVVTANGEFYFNTTNQSLYISDLGQNKWRQVGPPGVENFLITRWESIKVVDTGSTEHAIMVGYINGQAVAIVSQAAFRLANINPIPGFLDLVKGMTMSSSSIVAGDLQGRATSASTATALNPGATINGVLFTGAAPITIPITDVVNVPQGGTGITEYFPGQVLIGGNGNLIANTITGSGGIVVTNGPGSIDIGYSGISGVQGGSSIEVLQSGANAIINNTGVTSLTSPAGSGIGLSQTSGAISITNTGILSVNTPAQSGINVSTSNGVVSITNTGIKNIIPGSNVSVTVTDGVATISAAGGGGGGSPAFVTDILAGPGIGVSKNAQNAYTITNTGGGGGGGGGNYLLGSGNAGEIAMWGSTAAPTGWALCNGAAVSRTTYAKLFERIGITYGPGDGVNTFNLPNFNNRFAIGSGSDYNNGTTGGYQDSVVVAHSHSLANVTVTGTTSEAGTHQHGLTDPGHTHPYIDRYHPESSGFLNNKVVTNKFLWPGGKWNGNLGSGDGDSDNIGSLTYPGVTEKSATGATISSAGLHSHTINASLSSGSTATVGESGVKKNLPPFLAIAYIIKLEDDIITAITAGTGIAVTPTANTIAVTNTGVTSLSAGSGIILSGSTGGITISASVDTITAAPGSGITIASSAGSKSLSANVRSVVSGPGITVSSNDGVFTVSANTTSAPNIVWSQNSGSTSINLLLPAGQWVVTATFSNHEAEFPAQTLIIDGVVVQTSPNIGDPPGTSYRPMMGMHQVNAGTSGRTITCSVTGVTDFGNINARRFVVRADRLS